MKLFLFSASVFFFLGLKLTSKLDILPGFQNKTTHIEKTTAPSMEKNSPTVKKTEPIKKDTINSISLHSGQLTAPKIKNTTK